MFYQSEFCAMPSSNDDDDDDDDDDDAKI